MTSEEKRNLIVQQIVNIAKEEAEKGNKYFTYKFESRDHRNNLESQIKRGDIKSEVAKLTENTVKCCYRGNYWSEINFVIN